MSGAQNYLDLGAKNPDHHLAILFRHSTQPQPTRPVLNSINRIIAPMTDEAKSVEELQKKLAQLHEEHKKYDDEISNLRAVNCKMDAEIEHTLKATRDTLAPALRKLKSEMYENNEDLPVYLEACQMESMIRGTVTKLQDILDDLEAEEEEGDNTEVEANIQEIINELRKLWTEGNGKGDSLESYWKKLCVIWAEGNKKVEEKDLDPGVAFGNPSDEDLKRFE